MSLEEALEGAYRDRSDYLAAQERAPAEAAAAPSVPSACPRCTGRRLRRHRPHGETSLPTFSVAGLVSVPVFQGGRERGREAADAEPRKRRAERTICAPRSTTRCARRSWICRPRKSLEATTRGRDLAAQQLAQSRDRFAAGVANNLEVVQAQEAVTEANEQYIDALYSQCVEGAGSRRSARRRTRSSSTSEGEDDAGAHSRRWRDRGDGRPGGRGGS